MDMKSHLMRCPQLNPHNYYYWLKFMIIYLDKFSISEITSNSHTPGVFVKKKLESKASDVHVLIATINVNYRPWLLNDCSRHYQFISVENVLVGEFFKNSTLSLSISFFVWPVLIYTVWWKPRKYI